MKAHTRIAVVLVGCSAVSFAVSAHADAPPKPDASEVSREHFRRGVELFDEGDFKLALIEFERAYKLSSSFRILYNIGQVESQLGRYAKAIESLERYLKDGANRITPERKAEVERDIATLTSRTALLEVTGDEGADVTMDGEPIGRIPMAPQRVNAGEHRIGAAKRGFVAQEKHVVLAGGDVGKVVFSLDREPVQSVRTPENRTGVWLTWAGAGVLGAGAAVTGVFAFVSAADLKTQRDTLGSSQVAREGASDRARAFSIASDVLTGAAVVTGAFALYWTLKKPSSAGSAAATGDANVTVGLGSVGASGRF